MSKLCFTDNYYWSNQTPTEEPAQCADPPTWSKQVPVFYSRPRFQSNYKSPPSILLCEGNFSLETCSNDFFLMYGICLDCLSWDINVSKLTSYHFILIHGAKFYMPTIPKYPPSNLQDYSTCNCNSFRFQHICLSMLRFKWMAN